MAAPATHLLLANKIFDTYFSEKDRQNFYVGTSFPDIRYLGVIEREKTHFLVENISELTTLDAFTAGLKFHSLVDIVRENFMQSHNAYSLFPASPYATQALKLFEDQILYQQYSDWNKMVSYFDSVLPEESAYGLQQADIKRWHSFLQKYLATQPTDESVKEFVTAIGKPIEMAEEINALIEKMHTIPKLSQLVMRLYTDFEKLLFTFAKSSPTSKQNK